MGTETDRSVEPYRPRRGTRLLLVFGLLVLAPVGAEYIQAYDDHTGKPLALLGALVIFVPLYGAPAVLLRETACRFGIRWPGIIALAAGLGLLQAGVIDQSMFDLTEERVPYWESMFAPTFVEPLGLAVNPALSFVIGHAIGGFGIPIALVQGMKPDLARRPWLRWPGLTVLGVLYLGMVALFVSEFAPEDRASAGQIAGALTVTALLALYAFTRGTRPRDRRDRRTMPPLAVAAATTVAGLALNSLEASLPATVVMVGVVIVLAAGLIHLSGSRQWNHRHLAAAATGLLVSRAIVGFVAVPIGEVSGAQQLGHNIFFLVLSLLLGLWTMTRRSTTAPVPR